MAVAAIVAVAVLHFVIQTSFIQSETGKNRIVDEFPVKIEQSRLPNVEVEQVSSQTVESKSEGFEAKKINTVIAPKPVPQVRQNTREIVPSTKPQPKKKSAVETRAERLRRAELILTGI